MQSPHHFFLLIFYILFVFFCSCKNVRVTKKNRYCWSRWLAYVMSVVLSSGITFEYCKTSPSSACQLPRSDLLIEFLGQRKNNILPLKHQLLVTVAAGFCWNNRDITKYNFRNNFEWAHITSQTLNTKYTIVQSHLNRYD